MKRLFFGNDNFKVARKRLARHKLRYMAVGVITLLIASGVTGIAIVRHSSADKNLHVQTSETPETVQVSEQDLIKEAEKTVPLEFSSEGSEKVTSTGSCKMSGSDGNGNYYTQIRLQDGTDKCIKYTAADTKELPIDGTESEMTTANGRQQAVNKRVYTDPKTGATTTHIDYADGSSYSSTDGGYWKMLYDDYDANKRFYFMTNGMDMTNRFMHCMAIGYQAKNGKFGTRVLTATERAERAALPYPYSGPDCNAGNLPKVIYY